MKKYKVRVCFVEVREGEVDALNEEEAKYIACNVWDHGRCETFVEIEEVVES